MNTFPLIPIERFPKGLIEQVEKLLSDAAALLANSAGEPITISLHAESDAKGERSTEYVIGTYDEILVKSSTLGGAVIEIAKLPA